MRTKIIAFLLWASLPCFGQVAVDLDCIFRSYRVFGRVMLEVFGSDKAECRQFRLCNKCSKG